MKQVVVPADIESLARETVNAAYTVHRTLGPGLLESAYQQCLAIELGHMGLSVEREKILPLVYRGHPIETAYRVDLIINGLLLVELKAADSVLPIHQAQVVTYLKLLHLPLGLLINFNVPLIKNGITRVLNLDFQTEITPAQPEPQIVRAT
jgi:GxxExxY protein